MKQLFLISCLINMAVFCNAMSISVDTSKNNSARAPEIFDRAEVMPSYPGGPTELMKYLSENIKYPSLARENNLEGRVVVKFYVDTDGSVREPVILKDGVGGGCGEEALRVISMMPKWTPGSQRGKLVKVYYVLPVSFKLSSAATVTVIKSAFPGGDTALESYRKKIIASLKKPRKEKNLTIRVMVSFIVDADGKVGNATIVEKNTDNKENLDKIVAAVNSMPAWYPESYNGKNIPASKVITFVY